MRRGEKHENPAPAVIERIEGLLKSPHPDPVQGRLRQALALAYEASRLTPALRNMLVRDASAMARRATEGP